MFCGWGCAPLPLAGERKHIVDIIKKCRLKGGNVDSGIITSRFPAFCSRTADWRYRNWSCRRTGRRSGIRRSRPFWRFRKDYGCSGSEYVSWMIPSVLRFQGVFYHRLAHRVNFQNLFLAANSRLPINGIVSSFFICSSTIRINM